MPNNKVPNRLINEKSPYLLQHAYNPVEWFPWGEEAFSKAKEEDKPIFLSIGYSTCHWCHVMERESFEDEEVAKVLNKDYICIKVDREERPDVDSIYMSYCQAMTGSGGWPLTIIMTPDKKPFFAGTYFPKESKYGRPGVMNLLKEVTSQWNNKREKILNYSSNLLKEIKKTSIAEGKEELNEEVLIGVFNRLKKAFDSNYGGFYTAPKFPTPHKLMYLLRMWKVHGYKEALHMFEKTLDAMYKGGIFDHIGFGFSRYSTDKMWLAPHFEKMLYDNALLALVYAEAYAETKNARYKEVCEKIFWYLEDKMISKEGGLFSAEDADSEGVEGKFYLWTPKEIKEVLGEEDGEYFCQYFDVTEKGNFEGKNIANLIEKDLEEIEEVDLKKLNNLREKLYSYREKRIHPHKDDKILTSWNGLAIVAFAYAGRIFNNKRYIELGEKALNFILINLTRKDGRLLARYREGEAAYLAYLDDYAFLIWALIELYEATFKEVYLKKATHFNKEMINLFWDEEGSGFYMYGKDGEELLMRPKESFDNAIPSGNSVGIYNMLRLSNINEDMELKEKAEAALNTFSYNINHYPDAHLFMCINLIYTIKENNKIVIEGKFGEETLNNMISEINNRFTPFTDVKLDMIEENKTTAYVCKNYACSNPVNTIEEFIKLL
ncbi:thioredoxin domain-containing protein [Clostridium malenominatum]|uniref:Thioredoxin domain-containing protein n=1 Tax=Clostridium malenominatum TaxID=1539 RepID=A0ABN1IUM3_9CLOT